MCKILKTFYPCPQNSPDETANAKVYPRYGPIFRCQDPKCPYYEIDINFTFYELMCKIRIIVSEVFDDLEHCICGKCNGKAPAPPGNDEEDDDAGRLAIWKALNLEKSKKKDYKFPVEGMDPKERARKEKAAKEEDARKQAAYWKERGY